jgi:hypothetical protein
MIDLPKTRKIFHCSKNQQLPSWNKFPHQIGNAMKPLQHHLRARILDQYLHWTLLRATGRSSGLLRPGDNGRPEQPRFPKGDVARRAKRAAILVAQGQCAKCVGNSADIDFGEFGKGSRTHPGDGRQGKAVQGAAVSLGHRCWHIVTPSRKKPENSRLRRPIPAKENLSILKKRFNFIRI